MGVRDRNGVWANEPTRPRVLLECSPHDSPDLIAGAIERQGFDVGICTGPTTGVGTGGLPPPLSGGGFVVPVGWGAGVFVGAPVGSGSGGLTALWLAS